MVKYARARGSRLLTRSARMLRCDEIAVKEKLISTAATKGNGRLE
jgi:hypothetical protein